LARFHSYILLIEQKLEQNGFHISSGTSRVVELITLTIAFVKR
jgi:hypothetical protein